MKQRLFDGIDIIIPYDIETSEVDFKNINQKQFLLSLCKLTYRQYCFE